MNNKKRVVANKIRNNPLKEYVQVCLIAIIALIITLGFINLGKTGITGFAVLEENTTINDTSNASVGIITTIDTVTNETTTVETIVEEKEKPQNVEVQPEEKPPKPEPNVPPVWKSDVEEFVLKGKTSIDLSQYFYDANNDSLAYLFTTPEKVTVDIDASIVTLTPKGHNFTTTISFTATDGEKATTKEITLIVPEKAITINLEYKQETTYDADNDGYEPTSGVVDLSVENSLFSWDVDKTKLCTRWQVQPAESEEITTVCYGNEKCCNFVGIAPTRDKWDEVFFSVYGQYGTLLSNIISAQILYVDYGLSIDKPFAEIYYSNWKELPAKYYFAEIDFENVCVDTCFLKDFNETGYKLIFEIDNAEFNLDTLTYSIVEEISKVLFNLGIKDNKGLTSGNYQLYKDNTLVSIAEGFVEPDYYNIEVKPTENVVDKIVIKNVNLTKPLSASIGVDNVSREISIENIDVKKRYAVDLEKLEFEKATLTATAKGDALYKCRQWDYEREICFGEWVKVKELVVGEQYNLTLTKEDPGFIEGNLNITQINVTPINVTSINITNLTGLALINNIPNISIIVNSNTTINLSSYFSDIDTSTTFTYFNIDSIRISFENDIAVVIPNIDYVGMGFTFITANKNGNVVISDIFKIEVIKEYIRNETANESAINETYVLFNFADGERVNISSYIEIDGKEIKVPYKKRLKESRKFGFEFNESDVEQEFKSKSKAKGIAALFEKEKKYDKKIYYMINSSEEYVKSSHNPYILERNLTGQKKKVKNQIGQIEERQLKRFLSFEDIFNKEHNLFNITTKEVNVTVCINSTIVDGKSVCVLNGTRLVNVTTKQQREIGFNFIQQGKDWIVEFLNLFDLDPSFIDDTDTNWNAGTFRRMSVQGTGAAANLTAFNISGHYGSQIFDATATANWTNITLVTEVPYGIEIGRAMNDSNIVSVEESNAFGYINTSGLVFLMHFNNESGLGENDSLFRDFSPDVNSQRASSVRNNGTCSGTACPTYTFTNSKLGRGASDFEDTDDDMLTATDNPSLDITGNLAVTAWVNQESQQTYDMILMKGTSATCSTTGCNYYVFINTDEITFGIYNGGFHEISSSVANMVTNRWYHVGVTYNDAANDVILYVNGVAQSESLLSGNPEIESLVTNTDVLRIGFSNTAGEDFDGIIDELTIWNRSLSATEVRNLYLRGAYRLNVSARTCDDSACAGETYTNIQPNNITSGFTIPLNLSSKNRFFQYNITYSNESAYDVRLNVNNVSIEFVNDTILPIVNTSLNKSLTNINQNDVINLTANVTDGVGLSWCQFIENQSLANGAKQYINKTVTGISDQCSQNYTIALASGNVINFTVRVNDTSNNIRTNDTIITVASAANVPIIKLNNASGFAVDPIDGSTSVILLSFNVTDADGVTTINASKAIVNLTLGTPGFSQFRFNLSDQGGEFGTCRNHTESSTVIINCTVLLRYYDNASSNWVINVSVQDTSGQVGRNDTGRFTVNILSAISLPYVALNFSSVNLNDQNVRAYPHLLINNTGNEDFDMVNMSISALVGTTTTTQTIDVTNFGVNLTNSSTNLRLNFLTDGIINLRDTTTGGNVSFLHGHTSAFAPNADKGNISAFIWVNVPNSGISPQLYNATWNVTVVNNP